MDAPDAPTVHPVILHFSPCIFIKSTRGPQRDASRSTKRCTVGASGASMLHPTAYIRRVHGSTSCTRRTRTFLASAVVRAGGVEQRVQPQPTSACRRPLAAGRPAAIACRPPPARPSAAVAGRLKLFAYLRAQPAACLRLSNGTKMLLRHYMWGEGFCWASLLDANAPAMAAELCSALYYPRLAHI